MSMTLYRRNLVPSLFRDVFGEDFPTTLWDEEKGLRWCPAVDIYEKEHNLFLEVELPGVTKEGIKVNYADGVLTVSGERREEEERRKGAFFTKERFYGAFSRSFRIGDAYEPKGIEARFQDGILNVRIPKKEETKPIDIKVG